MVSTCSFFLDDIYIVCQPDRVRVLFDLVRAALLRYAHIEINMGKTRVWNAGCVEPEGARDMGTENSSWVGDRTLPDDQQGLVVLGAPLGSQPFVINSLQETRDHARLLSRLKSAGPSVGVCEA